MEEVVKGSSILRTEGQLTSFGWPKWVIQVTWELWRQEMLPGNRTVLAVEDITFLKKLCGGRSKNAWGGTGRCSKGLKWQEMLCSCGRTKGVGSIWRGKRECNCVCKFTLREWNVFIWHGYLLSLLFFIMYMSPASLCENVKNTLAKSTSAVWIMPE